MKEKNKWIVRCFLKDGTEVNPADIVIPKNHPVYRTIQMIQNERIRKEIA